MLKKMEKKGVVKHRQDGRQFVFSATVSESQVKKTMVSDLTQRLFHGDVTALVSHLIAEKRVDSGELARLKSMIANAEEERA